MEIGLYVFTSDKFRNVLPERINCTDASNRVCAGYCLHILGKIVHKRWTWKTLGAAQVGENLKL